MGITGLLPFLEKASKRTNINEFAGGTAAIDSYCWLHKGVFSCADKLSMGQPTDAYVNYCMKFIHMLLSHKIKPILVFDGRHLPAKAQTESKRQESRQTNRRKGIELMQMGQYAEGRNLLRRSIDVTHVMALELIKCCQKMNIDCIVAPYEADAQLAYLNITGIADVVITEDSDLTLFGCKKIFFKMDISGNGLLVDQEKLHLAMDTRLEHFDIDNFRYMCILSGCDYLPSLPGIGLHKAKKFIMKNADSDIHRALTHLGSYLNMKSLVVTKEYRDAFILALITFKHQLVFCPLKRMQVRLNPPTPDVTKEQLHYAGEETGSDLALQLAFGNCDPFSLKMLHNFDPDKPQKYENGNQWGKKKAPQHVSIWSREFKLKGNQRDVVSKITRVNTAGNITTMQTHRLKKTILVKQQEPELSEEDMLDIYKPKEIAENEHQLAKDASPEDERVSPILIRKANPFAKQGPTNKVSPSLLLKSRSRLRTKNISRFRRTILNEEVVESKFFTKSDEISSNVGLDADISSNLNEEQQMRVEKTEEKVNLEDSTGIESESHPMDIDDVRDTSFVSQDYEEGNRRICNEKLTIQYPNCINTSSNSDSGKSYLEEQETSILASSRDKTNVGSSLMSIIDTEDFDFLVQSQDIVSLQSDLFRKYNKSLSEDNGEKVKSKHKSSNSKRSVDSKVNTLNNTYRNQHSSPLQKQQSLLSMYGFEKRSNLKR